MLKLPSYKPTCLELGEHIFSNIQGLFPQLGKQVLLHFESEDIQLKIKVLSEVIELS